MNVPYSSVVDSFMYTMICTRVYVAHAISVLCKFLANPGRGYLDALLWLQWLLRYLGGSVGDGLVFLSCKEWVMLKGYVDSDYAGTKDGRRSTIAYMFSLCDNCISQKWHRSPEVLKLNCSNK